MSVPPNHQQPYGADGAPPAMLGQAPQAPGGGVLGFAPPPGSFPPPPFVGGYGMMPPPGQYGAPPGMIPPPMHGMPMHMPPPIANGMAGQTVIDAGPKDPKLTTVFLSGLSPEMRTDFVKRVVEFCGSVTNMKRAEDPVTGKGSGFAFVEFDNAEGVLRGMRLLNGLQVGEKSWKVKIDEKAQKFVDMYADKRKEELMKKLESEGTAVENKDEAVDKEQMEQDKVSMDHIQELLTSPEGPNKPLKSEGRGQVIERMVEEIAESTNLQQWEERERYSSAGVDKDKARLVSSEILAFRDRLEAAEREKKEREEREKKKEDPSANLEKALQSEAEEVERQERREKEREREEERRNRDRQKDMERRYRDKLYAVERLEKDVQRTVKRQLEKPNEEEERARRKRRELDDDEDSESDSERRARNRRDDRWKREKEAEKRADEADRIREKEEAIEAQRRAEEAERRRIEEEKARIEAEKRKAEEDRLRREREEREKQEAAHALKASFANAKKNASVKTASKPALFDAAVAEETHEENASKMRPLIPIEYTDEEMQAVDPNYAKKAQENIAARLKALIDSIPENEDELFATKIDWDAVDKFGLVDKKMKSWVTKKIVEMFGVEEKEFISFILKELKNHSPAMVFQNQLHEVLESDTRSFVAKMWRMLIFEVLRAKEGL